MKSRVSAHLGPLYALLCSYYTGTIRHRRIGYIENTISIKKLNQPPGATIRYHCTLLFDGKFAHDQSVPSRDQLSSRDWSVLVGLGSMQSHVKWMKSFARDSKPARISAYESFNESSLFSVHPDPCLYFPLEISPKGPVLNVPEGLLIEKATVLVISRRCNSRAPRYPIMIVHDYNWKLR